MLVNLLIGIVIKCITGIWRYMCLSWWTGSQSFIRINKCGLWFVVCGCCLWFLLFLTSYADCIGKWGISWMHIALLLMLLFKNMNKLFNLRKCLLKIFKKYSFMNFANILYYSWRDMLSQWLLSTYTDLVDLPLKHWILAKNFHSLITSFNQALFKLSEHLILSN